MDTHLPDPFASSTMAPIRRLLMTAFGCALIAVILLVLTAFHVMETTNSESEAQERARAARIADMLAQDGSAAASRLDELGYLAGLKGLVLTTRIVADDGRQVLPLLSGTLSGQFLSWIPDDPGQRLFMRFAPSRLPLGAAMIGSLLVCLLLIMRHVRKLETRRSLAERSALRDHLTGLPNRLALETELRLLAESGRPFSVLAMDLDRFKPVNDMYGHGAGDLALQDISQRLLAQLRPGEMLARVGGDEFVAIVQRGGGKATLTTLARDCIAAVAEPLTRIGPAVSVGVSLGIVENGLEHPSGPPLKLADRALYDAKRLNGGAFCFAGQADIVPDDAVRPALAG